MKIIKFFKYITLGILGIISLFLLFFLVSLAIGFVGKGMASVGLDIRDDIRMVCESGSVFNGDCIEYGLISLVILIPSLLFTVIMVCSLAGLGKLVEEIYQGMKSRIILKRRT